MTQPDADKTDKGFKRGSDARAAFIDWYIAQVGESFVSPRGIVRTEPVKIRFQALYHLEKAVAAIARQSKRATRIAPPVKVTKKPTLKIDFRRRWVTA